MKRQLRFITTVFSFFILLPLCANESTWSDGVSNVKFEINFPSSNLQPEDLNNSFVFKESQRLDNIAFMGDGAQKTAYMNLEPGEYKMLIPRFMIFTDDGGEHRVYGALMVSFTVTADQRTLVTSDYSNWKKHSLSVIDLPEGIEMPRKVFVPAGMANYSDFPASFVEAEDDDEGVYLQPQGEYSYYLDGSVVGYPNNNFVASSTTNVITASLKNGFKKQVIHLSTLPQGLQYQDIGLNYTDRKPSDSNIDIPVYPGQRMSNGSILFDDAGKAYFLVKEGMTLYLSPWLELSATIIEDISLTLENIQADAEHTISLGHLRQVKFNVTGEMFTENSVMNNLELTILENGKNYYEYNGSTMNLSAYLSAGTELFYDCFTQNPKLKFSGKYKVTEVAYQEINLSAENYKKVIFNLDVPLEMGAPSITIFKTGEDSQDLSTTYHSEQGVWIGESYLMPGEYNYVIRNLYSGNNVSIPVLLHPNRFVVSNVPEILSRTVDPNRLRNWTVKAKDIPETITDTMVFVKVYAENVPIKSETYNEGTNSASFLIEEGDYFVVMSLEQTGLVQTSNATISSEPNQIMELSFSQFRRIEVVIDTQQENVEYGILVYDQYGKIVIGTSYHDEGFYLKEGVYQLFVYAEGFAVQEYKLTVGAIDQKINILMTKDKSKFQIGFRVIDSQTGQPINAVVTVAGIEKPQSTSVSQLYGDDDWGAFFFNVPVANALTYTITAEGYTPLTKTIQMDGNLGGTLQQEEVLLQKSSTGLQQQKQQSVCLLYPNPASTWLKISGLPSLAQVRISTINGTLLINARIDNTQALDVSQLTTGYYIVTIQTVQGIITKALIIQ